MSKKPSSRNDAQDETNENRQPAKGSHCTHRVTDFNLSGTKKRIKFLPIVLFRRLRRIFHHNLLSHNRLEQNESPLPRANFGFQVKQIKQSLQLCDFLGNS